MPSMQNQNGFLMNLIYLNPAAFSQYGLGLENFASSQTLNGNFFFQGR